MHPSSYRWIHEVGAYAALCCFNSLYRQPSKSMYCALFPLIPLAILFCTSLIILNINVVAYHCNSYSSIKCPSVQLLQLEQLKQHVMSMPTMYLYVPSIKEGSSITQKWPCGSQRRHVYIFPSMRERSSINKKWPWYREPLEKIRHRV
jgi:hypothetical protein